MSNISKIFISYANKDRMRVQPLVKALKGDGWSVFWDNEVPVGAKWHKIIDKEINSAKCIIVVWSRQSVKSDWVIQEALIGCNKNILVPVLIEEITPPLGFRQYQMANLIHWDGQRNHPEYLKLVKVLEVLSDIYKPITETSIVEIIRESNINTLKISAGDFFYGEELEIETIAKDFEIDIYPVTNHQFMAFINDKGYTNDKYWSKVGIKWRNENRISAPYYWDDAKFNQPGYPVVGVNYYEAAAYAKWIGKVLPSEKQWERAARGTDGRRYPWGDKYDEKKCNTVESEVGSTTPVTQYPNGISPDGCYDMAGNVWEWTVSENGYDFVALCGGSWLDYRFDATCGYRHNCCYPEARGDAIGFRCAL